MSIAGTTAPNQGIGRAIKAGYSAESTFTAVADLSAVERFDLLSMSLKLEQERAERVDKRAAPGLYETICRKKSGTWAIESYLLPSGTAGVAPDIGSILQDGGFEETVVGGTSVGYTPRDGITAFSLLRDAENISELAGGCLLSEAKITWDGATEAKINLSGQCATIIRAGTSTLAAALSALDLSATVAEAEYFEVGSYVQFVGDTNAGVGYKITGRDTVANTITISPAAAVGAANGSAVSPIIPAGTLSGSPVCGNTGSVAIDGVEYITTGGNVTIANTVRIDGDNFGSEHYTDNYRLVDIRISFSVDLYATNPNLINYLRTLNHTGTASADMAIVLGSVAGSICTINLDYAQFEISELDIPDADAIMFTLSGKALSSAGNDWGSIIFT